MDWNNYFYNFNICWGLKFIHYCELFFHRLSKSNIERKIFKIYGALSKKRILLFFAFRFAGGLGIPFFLQNVLPVIFKMKNTNYFFASFLGFIPGFFIWNTIGAGVNTFIKEADEFSILNLILSNEIYIPVLIFIGLFYPL